MKNSISRQEIIDFMFESVEESIGVKKAMIAACGSEMIRAARAIAASLKKGGKVLLCGNGGSAADAQHIAAELVGRIHTERRPLPAVALSSDPSVVTCIGNDYGFERIFARQVEGLGEKKDVLVAYSTSGNSKNVIEAAKVAQYLGMKVVGITGSGGGRLKNWVDILIDVPSKSTPRIQESHCVIGHIVTEVVEKLMGLQE